MISRQSAALIKRCSLDAGLFVMAGGALAQLVHAAMDVGVIQLVELVHGVQNHLRFLGGGGVIQIDQRLAVDVLIQYGEVLTRHPVFARR